MFICYYNNMYNMYNMYDLFIIAQLCGNELFTANKLYV